jgi:serpin B
MPYKGNEMSLIVIFPDEGASVSSALSLLSAAKLPAMIRYLDAPDCAASSVSIPRFKIETPSIRMDEILKKLGVSAIFSAAADFSKMSSAMKSKPVDAYLHKTFFSLQENGQAAPKAKPKSGLFGIGLRHTTINRPFGFLVVENKTNAICIMGQVTDPSRN